MERGREVRPHHYIRSILPGGPVDKEGSLCRGDELLQVRKSIRAQRITKRKHITDVNIFISLISKALSRRSSNKKIFYLFQVNEKCLKDLFHDEVVSILKGIQSESSSSRNNPLLPSTNTTTLVCCRRIPLYSGEPTPVRGTIVNNVDVGTSRKAFDSRVSETLGKTNNKGKKWFLVCDIMLAYSKGFCCWVSKVLVSLYATRMR